MVTKTGSKPRKAGGEAPEAAGKPVARPRSEPAGPLTLTADGEQISDMELALTVLWNSVRRWMNQRSQAGEINGLSDLDVFVLHLLVYRNRPLRVIDIAFALAIDDMHQVTYSLKKLVRLDMITSAKSGKEVFYSVAEKGHQHYQQFLQDRQKYLEPSLKLMTQGEQDLPSLVSFLRTLSGVYDQAARSAASSKGI